MANKKILIAIVSYNESQNLPKLIRELKSEKENIERSTDGECHIVLFDDASTDDSLNICRAAGIDYVAHPYNSGGAIGVVMTYMYYADQGHFDYVVALDGDGQHLANEIIDIILPVLKGKCDYCIGSRYIKKEGFTSTILRRVVIKFLSTCVTFTAGSRFTDITSGMRAMNNKIIKLFSRQIRQDLNDIIQMTLLVSFSGASIAETPVKMSKRVHGHSEFSSPFKALSFPLKGLVSLLGTWIQKSQVPRL